MRVNCKRPICILEILAIVGWMWVGRGDAAELIYERDVAPILRSYCSGCHNDADRAGALSVERYASLRKGGEEEGDPIHAGNPDASFLIRSVEGKASPKMPPKDEPRVPSAELEVLKRWVKEGAKGPKKDESILETLVVPEFAAGAGKGKPRAITALAVSPDQREIVVGRYGEVEIRRFQDEKLRRSIAGLPGKVNAVHFAPDGKRVVIATGIVGLRGVARIHEVRSGKLVRELGGHRDVVQDAEWSPDGKLVATAGYDGVIQIWEVESGKMLQRIAVHNGAVFDLAFDPSGRVLASASADQTVKLWRVKDGVRLDTLNQPQGELYRVEFTLDGQHILAAGADKRLHLWRFVTREEPGLNPVITSRFAHDSAIQTFCLSKESGRVVTVASDGVIKLWKVPELVEIESKTGVDGGGVGGMVSLAGPERWWLGRMDGTLHNLDWELKRNEVQVVQNMNHREIKVPRTNAVEVLEVEPNDAAENAQRMEVPRTVKAAMGKAGDVDVYRFSAHAGDSLTLMTRAARDGAAVDTRIEVLYGDGRPVEQVVLQAVKDSWFTFRGKDSDTVDDFRLHNWNEMQLDEFLYANGEVVKLWLYPRGPDSGFKVYPGAGKRQPQFSTTALSHALNAPAYVVVALPAGTDPVPNGLPVFRLNYENDDDPTRRWGADSMLLFTAPKDGEYLARVTDVRGFGGGTNSQYRFTVRDRMPSFQVAVEGMNPKVSPGSGKEIRFVATREEGFDGAIRIEIKDLPRGFRSSSPIEIEAGQETAIGVIYAEGDAVSPGEVEDKAVRVIASAKVEHQEVVRELGTLGDLQVGAAPKVRVSIEVSPGNSEGDIPELVIRPGQTVSAKVKAVRSDFAGRIEFGNEDSGRNLPHGVYVDNIGLNGLLIVEGQTEREFFVTAAPKVKPGVRLFHLRTGADGGQVTMPVRLRVVPAIRPDAALMNRMKVK